jgi:hypothetical protein
MVLAHTAVRAVRAIDIIEIACAMERLGSVAGASRYLGKLHHPIPDG